MFNCSGDCALGRLIHLLKLLINIYLMIFTDIHDKAGQASVEVSLLVVYVFFIYYIYIYIYIYVCVCGH